MIKKIFLNILKKTEYGQITVITPQDQEYVFTGKQEGAQAHLKIKDWRTVLHVGLKGTVGLAEDYMDDLWDSDDITNLTHFFLQNQKEFNNFYRGKALSHLIEQLKYFFQRGTLSKANHNVHAHYDIGNDFYKLWLDPSMTYSSALFQGQDCSLEKAQRNKYQRILSLLSKNSGRLLEIGCGWGGFIKQALLQGDFAIKGITLSDAQHDYATQQLQQQADIALEDYRKQNQQYDHIVSIEMIEAVGERYWPVYFRKLSSLLAKHGQAVIQAITIRDDLFENYRRSSDMIRSFIFPGGMLFSPSRLAQEAERAQLVITDRLEFGFDYVKTLRSWLSNFGKKQKEVLALGLNQRFIKLWRLYLTLCIASFEAKRTNVIQVRLAHAS